MAEKMKKRYRNASFKFHPFSKKQKQVLSWWEREELKEKDAIICDGSVRAGKTIIMSLSYIFWAMSSFDGEQFGMAGKTIGSLRRNVIRPLKRMLKGRGYHVKDHRSDNIIEISKNGVTNYFFLFGGKDEASQDLVQGLTAAGFFFDEVALMPQSFVNQATARCSVEGRKYWFNCNPAGPYHWFKLEWLDKIVEKNVFHIHFTMDDNPSLSKKIKDSYKKQYSGVFYLRYILGKWVMSEGIIYDNFEESTMSVDIKPNKAFSKYYVSCDYGTQNPTTFLLWGLENTTWYCIDEYYHSGRESKKQKTDEEYSKELQDFVGNRTATIIVDPSAASFIAQLRKDGFSVQKAKNDVLDGIRATQSAMNQGKILFSKTCKHLFKEFASYVWDEKAAQHGEDKPVKEHDHSCDALRYFVYNIIFKDKKATFKTKPKWAR